MIQFFKPATFEQPQFVEILKKICTLLDDAAQTHVLHKSEKLTKWLPIKFMVFITTPTQFANIPQKLINILEASESFDAYETQLKELSSTTGKLKELEVNVNKLNLIFADIKDQVAIYLHGLLFLTLTLDTTKDAIYNKRESHHFISDELYRQVMLQGLYKAPVETELSEHEKKILALSLLEEKLEELHTTYYTQLMNSKTKHVQRI